MTPAVRTYFDRIRVAVEPGEPGKVEQAHKDACNVNTIVAKAHRTGLMPFANALATYGDFLDDDDYQSAMEKIKKADTAFLTLHPSLRAKFDNDPGKLLQFLSDSANKEAAIDLGLLPKTEKVSPEPTPTEAQPK